MKKVILFLMYGVFTLSLSGYDTAKYVSSDLEEAQVNCLELADAVYDKMLLQEQYYIASRAADAAYDSCVEQGGYAGDGGGVVVVLEAN